MAGDADIAAVNEAFGAALPEDEFDTIGGLVAHELGHVPRRGEAVDVGGLRFAVMLTRGGAVRWFQVARARRRRRRRALDAAAARRARWPPARPLAAGRRCGALQTPGLRAHRAVAAAAAGAGRCWPGACAAPRRAAPRWLGWCFGTAWLAAGIWWLFISMHRYGGLPAWLAVLAVLALAALLSLYLALAHGAVRTLAPRPAAGRRRCCSPRSGCWPNWRAGVLFTGFPWAASGYAQVDGPLAALAPWLGVYGIGALAALAGRAAGRWRRLARRGGAGCAGAALAVGAGAGRRSAGRRTSRSPAGTLTVTLLQGNVAQDEKFAARAHARSAGLAWREQLRPARGDLVVAPETAVPLLPRAAGRLGLLGRRCARTFAAAAQAALVGLPLGDYDARLHQLGGRAVGRQRRGGGTYRYDKHHLVPFGEFIPPGFRWFTEMMNIPLGDFNRGALAAPSFAVQGQRVAPNICYEDLFGEELAARFADPAAAPTILANVSNIGWFGDTIAVAQHLHISRMRALEFQRPMLRATNTGATAVIDHRGVVAHALPPLHARRARRPGAGPRRHHALRLVGRALRPVAAGCCWRCWWLAGARLRRSLSKK